jgi:ParB/RepB/Spo0J family partition protein
MAKSYNLKLHRVLISELVLVRKTADNLKNRIFMKGLEESISEIGVLMPLLVVQNKDEYKFTLIDGYKRLEVLKKLNKNVLAVNVLIAEGIAENMSLSANLVRVDLSKLYQALYLHNILVKERITQDELAKRFMLSKGEISKLLSVAKQPLLVKMVSNGMTMTSAKALAISVSSLPPDIQEKQINTVKKTLPVSEMSTRKFEKVSNLISKYIDKTHEAIESKNLVKIQKYVDNNDHYINSENVVSSLILNSEVKNTDVEPAKLIDAFKIICLESNPHNFKYEVNDNGTVSLKLKMTEDEFKKFKKLMVYNKNYK